MVYFGANDGMLHAVNGGFYDEGLRKFCRKEDCSNADNTAVLGEEMWAYVPYNLLPHLECLTDPNYVHKYFVDLRPRIFDVQIFAEGTCATDLEDPDCVHPGGWGTILVGGMRFGGAPVNASDISGDAGDTRVFKSAYFIMDITNPEKVPTLLGETTFTNTKEDLDDDGILNVGAGDVDGNANGILDGEISLGYTLAIPTMVPMNDGTNTTWYLILGSGPTLADPTSALEGKSDQSARLAVIPLHDRMNPTSGLKSLRIPTREPVASAPGTTDHEEFGTIRLLNADDPGTLDDETGTPYEYSFISDLITVDLETFPDYKADVVYFGTVAGGWTDGSDPDGWDGRMYRMVTRNSASGPIFTGASNQVVSKPSEWQGLLSGITPSGLNPSILYDPGQPIITAPTVGTDGLDFWVYFGTGRFFDVKDKTDAGSNATQSFYGIREPIGCSGAAYEGTSWLTVLNTSSPDVTPDSTYTRGNIGLLPVGDVAIKLDPTPTEDTPDVVGCYNGGAFDRDNIEAGVADCLGPFVVPDEDHPIRVTGSFADFTEYIVGNNVYCSSGLADPSPGFDGWSRDFLHYKERNLGQATLLGGLVSYSTYIPDTDVCNPEGSGYLYGIFYQTGTSWFKDVFGRQSADINTPIEEGIFLGKGLSTTPNIHVGKNVGGKAFIQTSVGQIVEIPQPNMPIENIKSGRIKWHDIE